MLVAGTSAPVLISTLVLEELTSVVDCEIVVDDGEILVDAENTLESGTPPIVGTRIFELGDTVPDDVVTPDCPPVTPICGVNMLDVGEIVPGDVVTSEDCMFSPAVTVDCVC